MKPKNSSSIFILTECAIMIALSAVLSVFKLFEMPYGGSITLASFLPIVVLAYRHGAKVGLSSALCASLIQLLLGLKNFSYFTTWQSIIALALFDYVLAFAVFGLSGIFRRTIKSRQLSFVAGAVFASVIRYICHVISGATIWAGLSIPTEAALIYSFSYNATYMIPETIILVLTCAYLASALDLTKRVPERIRTEKLDAAASYLIIGAGFALLASLITDTVLVFSKLQNADSGEFDITALTDVNWLAVGIITAVGTLTALALFLAARKRAEESHG